MTYIELYKDVKEALRAAHVVTFQHKSGYAKIDAQRNLQDLTHYYDDNTLKFFYARVLSSRAIYDGLFLRVVESAAKDSDNRERGFRVVLWDCFGNDVYRVANDDLFKTRKQAEKHFADNFTLDVGAYYKEKLQEIGARELREANRKLDAAKIIND